MPSIVRNLRGIFRRTKAEARSGPDWRVFAHPQGAFTLEYPASWTVAHDAQWSSLSRSDIDVAIMVSSFVRPGATIRQFFDRRMSVESDLYRPLGDPVSLATDHWVALVGQAKGHEASETEDTVRYSFCAARSEDGPVFVSLTGYVSEGQYPLLAPVFESIFHTLRFS